MYFKSILAIELDQTKLEAFLEEAVIMKDFDHLNVLSLYGVVIRNNEPHVILPYMENGDLKNYVKNEDNVSIKFTFLCSTSLSTAFS